MSIYRCTLVAFVFVAALPTLGHADPRLRLYVEGNPVKQRPVVNVFYVPTNPNDFVAAIGFAYSLEWTANGQPMSSNLTGIADCITNSAQRYNCGALKEWFWNVGAFKPKRVVSDYPEAFYIKDRDFDTEYCFRMKGDVEPDWSAWVCAHTPPAPAAPQAPPKPQVTKLAPTSGKGQTGGPTPFRLLVEWDHTDESLVASYGVELLKYSAWNPANGTATPPGQPTYEASIDMPSDADADDSYAVRVCASNIMSKVCSPTTRTPGRGWDEQRAKSTGGAFQPKYGDTKVVAVEKSDARNQAILSAIGGAGTPAPIDLNTLAAKGIDIANADPISVELRKRQLNDAARRGFDIGMAAAEGNTEPGPGKQRIHDALSPAEQVGLDAALTFSLERNRNAELAAKGAAIAQQDPATAGARDSVSDPMYWLGFDIATGIFGDPALGAKGNTATGPGSMKIRDALNASAQAGFNAAVAFHLARVYPR